MSRNPVSQEDVHKMRRLVLEGVPLKLIAERFNYCVETVRYYTKDLQKHNRRGDCIYYLQSPEGERYVVDKNITDFAFEHNLTPSCFQRISTPEAIKRGAKHKGWSAYKPFEYVPVRDKSKGGNRLNPLTIFEIEMYAKEGLNIEQIAAKLDISPVTAQKYVNRWRMNGNEYSS